MHDTDVDDEIARLYEEQRNRMRRVAYLMVGGREDAEEIVHDAFSKVAARWRSIDRPAAYLRTSVVNLCLEWRRRADVARRHAPAPAAEAFAVAPPEIDETWALLERLPRNQRVALVLRFYEDLPLDEVARVMGCRPATARTRIHRALAQLRKEMTP
jgi:RNA polymerase sigma factor (sigma-70 family)